MRIVCQQTILMNTKPHLIFLKTQHHLKLSSAAKYRWSFMIWYQYGYLSYWVKLENNVSKDELLYFGDLKSYQQDQQE